MRLKSKKYTFLYMRTKERQYQKIYNNLDILLKLI